MKKSFLNLGKTLTSKQQQEISGGQLQESDCYVVCNGGGHCWTEDGPRDPNMLYTDCY